MAGLVDDAGELRKVRALLAVATAGVVGLWFIPGGHLLTLPVRYFVTFLHEIGHAAAAYATGGSAERIEVFTDGSGVTLVRGGWPLITYASGYVGSTLFAVLLLTTIRKAAWAEAGFFALAALLGLSTLGWVRPFWSFGFLVGAALAAGFVLAGRVLHGWLEMLVLQFLAVQCALSSLWDVAVLLELNVAGSRDNDAAFLAERTGVPAVAWGLLWAAASLALLWRGLRWTWRTEQPTANGQPPPNLRPPTSNAPYTVGR